MALIRPPITGDPVLDSWTDQLTRMINQGLIPGGTTVSGGGGAGTGAPGRPGTDGSNGINSATVYIYRRTMTETPAPAIPTGPLLWNYSNAELENSAAQPLTNLNGWSEDIGNNPDGGNYLWVLTTVVSDTGNTDVISPASWGTPVLIGVPGSDGTDGRSSRLDVAYATPASTPVTDVQTLFGSGTVSNTPTTSAVTTTEEYRLTIGEGFSTADSGGRPGGPIQGTETISHPSTNEEVDDTNVTVTTELFSANVPTTSFTATTFYVGARPPGVTGGTVIGTSSDGTHAATILATNMETNSFTANGGSGLAQATAGIPASSDPGADAAWIDGVDSNGNPIIFITMGPDADVGDVVEGTTTNVVATGGTVTAVVPEENSLLSMLGGGGVIVNVRVPTAMDASSITAVSFTADNGEIWTFTRGTLTLTGTNSRYYTYSGTQSSTTVNSISVTALGANYQGIPFTLRSGTAVITTLNMSQEAGSDFTFTMDSTIEFTATNNNSFPVTVNTIMIAANSSAVIADQSGIHLQVQVYGTDPGTSGTPLANLPTFTVNLDLSRNHFATPITGTFMRNLDRDGAANQVRDAIIANTSLTAAEVSVVSGGSFTVDTGVTQNISGSFTCVQNDGRNVACSLTSIRNGGTTGIIGPSTYRLIDQNGTDVITYTHTPSVSVPNTIGQVLTTLMTAVNNATQANVNYTASISGSNLVLTASNMDVVSGTWSIVVEHDNGGGDIEFGTFAGDDSGLAARTARGGPVSFTNVQFPVGLTTSSPPTYQLATPLDDNTYRGERQVFWNDAEPVVSNDPHDYVFVRFVGEDGAMGASGPGFFRIERTGTAPATITEPTPTEFSGVANRAALRGDIATVTYDTPNAMNQASRAFSYDGVMWEAAEAFIDGDLIVDGAVFSNQSLSVGITSPQAYLNTDADRPVLPDSTNNNTSGGFLARVNSGTRNDVPTLFVGSSSGDHMYFDGTNLTISGVTIEANNLVVNNPISGNVTGSSGSTTSGVAITTDDTPPTNPRDGDLWYFTGSTNDDPRLFVRYDDGSNAQWVDASPAQVLASNVTAGSGINVNGNTISVDNTVARNTSLGSFATRNSIAIGDVTGSGNLASQNAVTTAQLPTSINSGVANAVSNNMINAAALRANNTNTTTIDGGNITTGTIVADQIAAGAITARALTTATLNAAEANIGTAQISALTAASAAITNLNASQINAANIDTNVLNTQSAIAGRTLQVGNLNTNINATPASGSGFFVHGSGSQAGDVTFGDTSQFVSWDTSEGRLEIRGDIINFRPEFFNGRAGTWTAVNTTQLNLGSQLDGEGIYAFILIGHGADGGRGYGHEFNGAYGGGGGGGGGCAAFGYEWDGSTPLSLTIGVGNSNSINLTGPGTDGVAHHTAGARNANGNANGDSAPHGQSSNVSMSIGGTTRVSINGAWTGYGRSGGTGLAGGWGGAGGIATINNPNDGTFINTLTANGGKGGSTNLSTVDGRIHGSGGGCPTTFLENRTGGTSANRPNGFPLTAVAADTTPNGGGGPWGPGRDGGVTVPNGQNIVSPSLPVFGNAVGNCTPSTGALTFGTNGFFCGGASGSNAGQYGGGGGGASSASARSDNQAVNFDPGTGSPGVLLWYKL